MTRLKLIMSVVAFFIVVGLIVGVIQLGSAAFSGIGSSGVTTKAQPSIVAKNAITRENLLPGTNSWKIPPGREAFTQIQAYAGATSVAPGKSLAFYVSTEQAGTTFSIDVFRLGWYQGFGARLMLSVGGQVGLSQGYYDQTTRRLIRCESCIVDPKTGLMEANWKKSYLLNIPLDWVTGVYMAKLTEATSGKQTYVPFDVLGNPNSAYVAVTPDTTYAAYNDWGGASLYEVDNHTVENTTGKGTKVSFDRPYIQGFGSSQVFVFMIQAIHWMEQKGYDLAYISNVNVHEDPGQLLNHKAYLSLGHDEYWTKEMRDGVQAARDHGVGLAFLGANASYWQMRFEPDNAQVPDRTIVCYKVESGKDLTRDPFYLKDNTRVTSLWRDPIVNRPEDALVGIMFSDLTHKQLGYPWQVSAAANSPLLKGTGLQPGQKYGCGVVGYEWDKVFPDSPKGLQILSTSKTINDAGQTDSSNSSYYIASSGAMVFATGSLYWTTVLDSYRLNSDQTCGYQNAVVPGMQALMANVMDALVVKHTATV